MSRKSLLRKKARTLLKMELFEMKRETATRGETEKMIDRDLDSDSFMLDQDGSFGDIHEKLHFKSRLQT